jgi:hypothetical protein
MRKSESNTILPAFSLTLAVFLVLACGMQRVNGGPSTTGSEARLTAPHIAAFPISPDGTAGAVLTTGTFAPPMAPALGLTMADFTGDTHPDLATVELEKLDSSSALYWIEIRLTEGGHQVLKLRAPFGGLLITPKDVTGDGNLDLIVRSAKSRAPVALFLNDGSGHFPLFKDGYIGLCKGPARPTFAICLYDAGDLPQREPRLPRIPHCRMLHRLARLFAAARGLASFV